MIRALLGGTFDPVHSGHAALVSRILDDGLADHVTVVPARLSPHKDSNDATGAERLAMVRLVFDPVDGVDVDPRELLRPGPSYTYDTLAALADEHPDDAWRLVIGADNLDGFPTWHRYRELLALAPLLVFAREGRTGTAPPEVPEERIMRIPDFDMPMSSTGIRAMLVAGQEPAGLPAVVLDHIRARGLYRG